MKYGPTMLRSVENKDMGILMDLLNDPDISSSVIDFGFPVSTRAQENWFKNVFPYEDAHRFIIEVDDETVGTIICSKIDSKNKTGEIGYKVARAFQGNNYAYFALCALKQYLFDETDLECISAYHFANNIASKRVLEKAGFRFEGTLRKAAYRNGQRVDLMYWSCTKEDFYKNRKD